MHYSLAVATKFCGGCYCIRDSAARHIMFHSSVINIALVQKTVEKLNGPKPITLTTDFTVQMHCKGKKVKVIV